ncbi:hypothetical protein C1646_672940 [Rhizophagus diaphanus]|nr:hypothetical protein C1646_672940 [Rhizophagus diaphanus] [Rhizophagus sp. MUCL 43196]
MDLFEKFEKLNNRLSNLLEENKELNQQYGGCDIRVVVGLDFGTTYSGFSYGHVSYSNRGICTNDNWLGNIGNLKTNTALQYDDSYNTIMSWGVPALAKRPNRREKNISETKPVELFKLHLGNLSENLRPKLPIDYKKAITDYLHEIGKLIKDAVGRSFPEIDFHENVLLVLTVPTEYSEKDKAIMRKCVYEAGLIKDIHSGSLQFTTEPEAATIYCMENLSRDYDLLTTEREVTESTGDFCGSTFIDKEFVNFLRNKLEIAPYNKSLWSISIYDSKFCNNAKIPFAGDSDFFFELVDIEETAPVLLKYVNEETRNIMEGNDWVIEINYKDIKAMFDPVVDRIIRLIHLQLSNAREECSTMFLVGGFSESTYLQKGLEENFNIEILKYTYGIKMEGDPIERKIRDGRIDRFHCLAKRDVQVDINEEFTTFFTPLSPMQSSVSFRIYYTTEYNAKYCDEPGMKLLGKLIIDLSGSDHLDKLLFGFSFGQMEFAVTVKNETNGQFCRTKFEIDG